MKELKTLKENLEKRRMIPAPTELKTLKDLEEGKYSFKGLVRLDHLKAEAVKWVKEFEKKPFNGEAKIWFMKFHNLTEDDLK